MSFAMSKTQPQAYMIKELYLQHLNINNRPAQCRVSSRRGTKGLNPVSGIEFRLWQWERLQHLSLALAFLNSISPISPRYRKKLYFSFCEQVGMLAYFGCCCLVLISPHNLGCCFLGDCSIVQRSSENFLFEQIPGRLSAHRV